MKRLSQRAAKRDELAYGLLFPPGAHAVLDEAKRNADHVAVGRLYCRSSRLDAAVGTVIQTCPAPHS